MFLRPRNFALALALLGGSIPSPGWAQALTFKITSFSPAEASYLGKTPFVIGGDGFTDDTRVMIDGAIITPVVLSPTKLTGQLPPHAVTLKALPVRLENRAGGQALLNDALSYIGPLTVSAVLPKQLAAGVGGPVEIRGVGFTPQTQIHIENAPLTNLVFVNARTIRGNAPAMSADQYDVKATEPGSIGPPITHTLVKGLAYVGLARPGIPGPQQLETSLAEGTARFSWFNPVRYDSIEVLDVTGKVVQTLSGDRSSLEINAQGLSEIALTFRGTVETRPSEPSRALAKIFACTPQALAGAAAPGELDLSLRGDHDPATVVRCGPDPVALAGGGAAVIGSRVSIDDLGSMGRLHTQGTIGSVYQEWQMARFNEPNSLITGFVLLEDAIVLEVAGYYEKLANFPGLELRGKITQVATPEDPNLEDGFTDEFSFPAITLGGAKGWHPVNYYRANKDVSYIPNPNDPSDTPPEPCRDDAGEVRRIPRGEYRLEIYAVGGDAKVQHFTFADDSREHELLIPGVPCPPYPLVRVRDMTGRKTLPTILKVEAQTLAEDPKPFIKLTAIGSWLDEDGNPHYIGPIGNGQDGEPDNPDFEYIWKFDDNGGTGTSISSGSASTLSTEVEDWGCYYIDLIVKDKACPRSVKRSYQVAVTPTVIPCTIGNNYFSFLFPSPEPSGIAGIVGLEPPPGFGKFENPRPVEFRVLTAPKYYCQGHLGASVFVSDDHSDVEFTLATKTIIGTYVPIPGVELEVKDLCPDVLDGPKYLHITIVDIGSLPPIPGVQGPQFRSVYFVGKTTTFYQGPAYDQAYPVATDPWHAIGPPLRLANHPPMLDTTHWQGTFDEQSATYHFSTQATGESREHMPIGDTKAIDLPIEGLPPGTGLDSYQNDLTAGFNARFKVCQEEFLADDGIGGSFGDAMGNRMEGKPVSLKPTTTTVNSFAGPGGGGLQLPEYHWEDCRDLFHQSFSQSIFESILYTGTIGPVPVTVWASIGLGLDILLQSRTRVDVRPFAALEGSGKPSLQSDFFLLGEVNLSIPCEVRADVLFGIASIAARLIPEATINLDAHVGSINATPSVGAFMGAYFSLLFEIEACIWAVVDEVCYSPGAIKILDNETLIEKTFHDGVPTPFQCQNPIAGPLAAGGGLDSGVDDTYRLLATSRPGTASSPNGDTTLYFYSVQPPDGTFDSARALGIFSADDQSIFNVNQAIRESIDPAGAFLTNSKAYIAWTRGGFPPGVIPAIGIDRNNIIATYQDILITPIVKSVSGPWVHQGEATFINVSDDPAEVPPASRRADGMAAIGADLSPAAQQAGGESIVAWVRYDGPFLVQDGTQTLIYDRKLRLKDGMLKPYFEQKNVNTTRPNLEHTAIYSRRVSGSGAKGPMVKISPAGVGINLEPAVAVSPSGNTAYCVWVHDSSIDPVTGDQHVNLTDSNLGRNLMYSIFSKAAGTWSQPALVLPAPDDFPGLLEPSMALSGEDQGLLAFTALSTGASQRDTGLSNTRHVFAVRLVNGAFGDPVLIHGECLSPETGHWPIVAWTAGVDIPWVGGGRSRAGEFLMTYQGTGPSGSRAGAGNVMAAALGLGAEEWTAPVCLTKDGNIHSNVAAAVSRSTGRLKTLHMNGGLARQVGIGGGTFVPVRSLQALDTGLEPDAAIKACRLSDPFPAPGSKVSVIVEVENLGLAGTPEDASHNSLLTVAAVFIDDNGRERIVVKAPVPVLQPGESEPVTLELEMPHDPVRLRVELEQGATDRDPSNDSKECLFGAPAPRDLACDINFYSRGEDESRAVARLQWSNPAIYEEVRVYRDGSMVAALSGETTAFVDTYAAPGPRVYEVRGLIGVSKSRRTACEVLLPPPPSGEFLRGDSDLNTRLELTDAVSVLGYLFLAGPDLACQDAADADDNGELEITDAVRILGYLFLGDAAPPAPGPVSCGRDPTPDSLPACGADCR